MQTKQAFGQETSHYLLKSFLKYFVFFAIFLFEFLHRMKIDKTQQNTINGDNSKLENCIYGKTST